MRFLRLIVATHIACCSPVYSLLNVPCSLMYDLDYCHKTTGHVASRPQPVGSPKMLSIALVVIRYGSMSVIYISEIDA